MFNKYDASYVSDQLSFSGWSGFIPSAYFRRQLVGSLQNWSSAPPEMTLFLSPRGGPLRFDAQNLSRQTAEDLIECSKMNRLSFNPRAIPGGAADRCWKKPIGCLLKYTLEIRRSDTSDASHVFINSANWTNIVQYCFSCPLFQRRRARTKPDLAESIANLDKFAAHYAAAAMKF